MTQEKEPRESPLRRARYEKGLSQEELASLLQVSSRAIRAWEQGKRVPRAYYRHLIEQHLNMSTGELNALFQIGESDEQAFHQQDQEQPTYRQWLMPHPRNEFFTAREELLSQLSAAFTSSESGIAKQILTGLPGVGKTQIAIEYTYRYREMYQVILWVTADTKDALLSDFVRIASLLRLPEKDDSDKWRTVDAIKQWLNSHADWLLVLDNVEDPNSIRDFLPQEDHGHILLTTRDSEGLTTIPIYTMEIEDGAVLLLRRSGLLPQKGGLDDASEHDREQAQTVSRAMDGLPLALDQAGAFVAETQCTIAEYLVFYDERRKKLLQERGRNHSGHPDSLVTTLLLSFEKIEQANPLAADMLRLCAFLHSENIPEELFMTGDMTSAQHFHPLASNVLFLTEATRELLKYSLVQRLGDTKTISIHRLVQDVLQDQMDEEAQHRWAEYAVRILSQLFSPFKAESFKRYQRYIAHALICLGYIDRWEIFDENTFILMFLVGFYLRERALYDQAEPVCQHTLDIAQKVFPSNFAFITLSLENLAVLYTERADYEKAEALYLRAYDICSRDTNPNTALAASILYEQAYLYKMQGKGTEALLLTQQLLLMLEALPERDDQIVMNSLAFLAELYCILENYEQAAFLLRQAIIMYTSSHDTASLDGTHLLNTVMLYFYKQGSYEEAARLCQPVLEMAEALWGPQHPDTARICANITEIYIHTKEMTKAEQSSKRSIEIYETVGQSVYLPRPLCYLATVCLSQKRYYEAEARFKQALAIIEEKFGPEDKQMAAVLEGYKTLLQLMRRDDEADVLAKRIERLLRRGRAFHNSNPSQV